MDIEKLTYLEVQEHIKQNPVAILPIGAVEAHGPHLPVGTDNFWQKGWHGRLQKSLVPCCCLLFPTARSGALGMCRPA